MSISYEILRPPDIPYRLLSFEFYFENANTRIVNLYHAAGMSLVYHIEKICYALPQNEFYELLKLQNISRLHDEKYNWLIMKVNFGEPPRMDAELLIEDPEDMNHLVPDDLTRARIKIGKLPEPGTEIILQDKTGKSLYYHLICEELLQNPAAQLPVIAAKFAGSFKSIAGIINLWCDEDNKLGPLA
ncbi:MAG TPA: hypothetical protein VG847_10300 [Chitinophagaceae bacterium]|nr:hypothetical protein [Chitinophagaceae bacterium]